MNIQIFFIKKNFEVQKAIRFFKERGVSLQPVDLKKRPLSGGELKNLIAALGQEALVNTTSRAYEQQNISYFGRESEHTRQLLLEKPELLNTPIVRHGRQATVGYCPEVWQTWECF